MRVELREDDDRRDDRRDDVPRVEVRPPDFEDPADEVVVVELGVVGTVLLAVLLAVLIHGDRLDGVAAVTGSCGGASSDDVTTPVLPVMIGFDLLLADSVLRNVEDSFSRRCSRSVVRNERVLSARPKSRLYSRVSSVSNSAFEWR